MASVNFYSQKVNIDDGISGNPLSDSIKYPASHYFYLDAKRASLKNYIEKYYPNILRRYCENVPIFQDDYLEADGVYVTSKMFVAYDVLAHIVYVTDIADCERLTQFLEKVDNLKTKSATNKIYRFDTKRGQYTQTLETVGSIKNYVGRKEYISTIESDLKCLVEKKELLSQLGMESGTNYLFYGPPGTGKTSFIKMMAAADPEISIFIIDTKSVDELSNAMMSPTTSTIFNRDGTILTPGPINFVIMEDFGLYMDKHGGTSMSKILNALDGLSKSYGTIRFFSVNNTGDISTNRALMSRMARTMYFDLPSLLDIKLYLQIIFPNETIAIETFINEIDGHELTIRNINHYISKYVLSETPVESSLNNIGKWIQEMQELNSA